MTSKDERLLREWEAIMRRIESIDARLWQGAGTLLVMSLGGITLLGRNPATSLSELAFTIAVGIFSLAILGIWWLIFHRWIHLQRRYSQRVLEIEEALDLRFNTYTRLLEYWKKVECKKEIDNLKHKDPVAYQRLESFSQEEHRRKFVHITIQNSLRALTTILGISWLAFLTYHIAVYLM